MKLFSKILTMVTALLAFMVGPAFAEKIKIGVVLPYSGGAAQFGEQIDRGMNLFVSQNKDAFGGHEIVFGRMMKRVPDIRQGNNGFLTIYIIFYHK